MKLTSPFGSAINTRSYSSGAYRYGFNGKETDEESFSGAIAFEARILDSRIGRFLSLDPLSSQYPWNCPYSFAENKVTRFIDLEGLEAAPSQILWNDIGINSNTSQSCVEEVNKAVEKANQVTKDYIIPGVAVVGGVVAIIVTAGAAAPVFATVASVLSGTMAVVGGSVKIGLTLAGERDAASKVPTSYLGGTVSVVLKVVNGENTTTQNVSGVIEIVEGVATLNFKPTSSLDVVGNIISIVSITQTTTEIINNIGNIDNGSSTESSGAINAKKVLDKKSDASNTGGNSNTAQTSSSSSNTNTTSPNESNSSPTSPVSNFKKNWNLNSNNSTIKCDQDNLRTPQTPIVKPKTGG